MKNILPQELINKEQLMINYSIILGYRGSHAHGLYIPSDDPNSIDDIDIMGIVIPPIDYYFGLKQYGSRGTYQGFYNEWDYVFYEFKKFINMLIKSNPNVITMLWLDDEDYIHLTSEGEILIENRELFSSKELYHTFIGYTYNKLSFLEHKAFKGYMGEKRKQLVLKYGYDTKDASHLIRLLKMGIEFFETGQFNVKRTLDREELLDIKKGKYTLQEIQDYAAELFFEIKDKKEKSTLPENPDNDKINQLTIDIMESIFCKD